MKAHRIPCSGETLLGSGYRADFGGKGSNQAVGCARLGAQVEFVAKLGEDSFAEMALSLFRAEEIDTAFVRQCREAPTGVGFIVVERATGHNCIILDPGANELLNPTDVSAASEAFESASVVLTQLEIPATAAEAAMKHGRTAGALTILNPAPVRPLSPSVFEFVDVLTPNETEAKVLSGIAPDAAIGPQEIARRLVQQGVRTVVMTLGEKGALLVNDASFRHFPAVSVAAVDTTGAGDAFNAGLAAALAHNAGIEEAVQFAVIIGGMAVMKEGVIPSLPRHDEVLEFCAARDIPLPNWFTSAHLSG